MPPLTNLAKQITVKSAVNPALWSCVIAVFMFILGSQSEGWKAVVFILVGGALVLCFIGSYLYFVIYYPNFLRSEEFQLKAESLQLLGDKDNIFNTTAYDVVSLVSNPTLPAQTQSKSTAEQLPSPIEQEK